VAELIEQDVREFDLKVRQFLGSLSPAYTVEPKIAGVPVEMTYKEGRLSAALTPEGQDVSHHVKTILSVPLTLGGNSKEPLPNFITVSAVVYIEKQALSELNQERTIRGLPLFLYGREGVKDSLEQINARVAAKRPLDLFCHRARLTPRPSIRTHYELMLILQQWGFRVNRPHIRLCHSVTEILEYSHYLRVHRGSFPYDLDGSIISVNDLSLQERIAGERRDLGWMMVHTFRDL
jgi:DNA ligase (NAD+)